MKNHKLTLKIIKLFIIIILSKIMQFLKKRKKKSCVNFFQTISKLIITRHDGYSNDKNTLQKNQYFAFISKLKSNNLL